MLQRAIYCDVIIPTAYARRALSGAEQMRIPNCDVIMLSLILREKSSEISRSALMNYASVQYFVIFMLFEEIAIDAHG